MAKLLPVLLALAGVAGGATAGYVLRDAPEERPREAAAHPDCPPPTETIAERSVASEGPSAFIEFDNQFVIPVTSSDAVVSLVVLSVTLEVPEGTREAVLAKMPKLRDAFLGVLFDHSSAGGFSAGFVNGRGLDTLRRILKETAIGTADGQIFDVLIVDLVKQDV